MEKLIQLLQSEGQELGALARIALGFLLPVCIVVGLVALRWIRRGGAGCSKHAGVLRGAARDRPLARGWLNYERTLA